MGLFRRDEEDFDDSAAFESDSSGMFKMILLVIFLILVFVGVGWFGYGFYKEMINNDSSKNVTINPDTGLPILPKGNKEGEVIVNFSNFNASVKENLQGLYYYTTQERVTGETCYIKGVKKDCRALTNTVCAKNECQKEVITVTDCFVNNQKIDCPE